MKKTVLLLAFIALGLLTHTFAQNTQDAITGMWDAGKANVEVRQVGNRFIGNPINPQGQRNEQIEVLNLEYDDGKWVGKIYNKEKDRLFDVVCRVKEQKLLLKVSAGFRSKEVEWTRVN